MHFEQRSFYSRYLEKEMPFNIYGHTGKPVLVFPSSGGSQNEYADFGMIASCSTFIESGLLRFYTPDSYDNESWLANNKSAHEMAEAHNRYEGYIINELAPLMTYETDTASLIATGCSMGGFHTMNFSLKHPDVFDTAIALSGVYDARFFTGDYYNDLAVYFNSPIDYLPNMEDPWFIDRYRQNTYVICVGQGDWELPHLLQTQNFQKVFEEKTLPAWFDYWGKDSAHDWDWWNKQMPYFLDELHKQGKLF
ncbi:prolyl oligopeptidase family serine peptidase [Tetragenococcus koreensis]|uniref:Transposase n=1 Tax=Tetragenococcus koreensis TaxID=290335 RepID=A0AAN4RII9_9ENTE|nr:alpha/beta hydrolase-fold protein [Tetragenococcus koreensis]MCF1584608.1 prolyl oligopeptidase family serine peptidase [Tetragenococcus koreensis]MCF1614160.1 prolyl oligopeptidase family serine peptidase [Tetragenococcus koreensis]MCF1617398.1 prolyl oligopeptidase family serine peptidase [Tetragenococcus koreensis]MCF1619696.1 prolyl oligopeptidase family serine peptidase [Tetragenococcus koreensis]MCF1622186.1 prolyl oligopeptidase family serine peptidase [Tetragenococcus koreensis]